MCRRAVIYNCNWRELVVFRRRNKANLRRLKYRSKFVDISLSRDNKMRPCFAQPSCIRRKKEVGRPTSPSLPLQIVHNSMTSAHFHNGKKSG